MTLVDRPLIQYAIDDARAAGITDFIFVTSRSKGCLRNTLITPPILKVNCADAASMLFWKFYSIPIWTVAKLPMSGSINRLDWACGVVSLTPDCK